MSATTTNLALPYPELGIDAPNGPAQIQALAQALDTLLAKAPVGDASNSVTLTSGDVRLTASAQTTILTASVTLTRQQWVTLLGKARIDNSGGAAGAVGVHITVDGTQQPLSHAGPIQVEIDAGLRNQITTGAFNVLLAAGSHTINFNANRDSTGVLDAVASGTLSTGPTYHSTALIITV